MKSILTNRPALAKAVNDVAEVAGYLWQKGWAERHGGNITVNITEYVEEEIFCKGTNRRMRDLARWPMENGSVIRILDDCAHYEIIADAPVKPTSELPSHLAVHNRLIEKGSPYRASLHTHPIELIAMTHSPRFLQADEATRVLWSMLPESRAFCPRGLGMIPYKLPGSVELAEATIQALEKQDVAMWEKHGVFAIDTDIISAFDQVDVMNKAALIYIASKNMGFEPDGMTQAQMDEIKEVFHLPG